METAMDKYLDAHCSVRNEALDWLERQTNIRTNYPRMLSGKIQGAFLYMLSRMIQPRNVLEIGTFTGYSAICIALGLAEDGHIDTLEINDELQDLTEEGFERAGVAGKISLHIRDALEFLADKIEKCEAASLLTAVEKSRDGEPYDMVFIDANKREYPDYYEFAVRLTRPGGFILADDVLWNGKVYAEQVPTDKQTSGIVNFNEMTASDPRVETVIIPVRHGLGIVRKK